MKVRSIASTLLETPDQRKGPLAMQAQVRSLSHHRPMSWCQSLMHLQEYLSAFLKILMRLERVSPANSNADDSSDPEDEEAELRNWADLREYQLKFTQQGGFLGLS